MAHLPKHPCSLSDYKNPICFGRSTTSQDILKHIDTFIAYPILFILKRGNAEKAVIAYKEVTTNNQNRTKVDTYFETPWTEYLQLEIKGTTTDTIYNNFLKQISPNLEKQDSTDIKVAVEEDKTRQKIQKQIDTIKRQITNEPQPNKRQNLARQRIELEKQLR